MMTISRMGILGLAAAAAFLWTTDAMACGGGGRGPQGYQGQNSGPWGGQQHYRHFGRYGQQGPYGQQGGYGWSVPRGGRAPYGGLGQRQSFQGYGPYGQGQGYGYGPGYNYGRGYGHGPQDHALHHPGAMPGGCTCPQADSGRAPQPSIPQGAAPMAPGTGGQPQSHGYGPGNAPGYGPGWGWTPSRYGNGYGNPNMVGTPGRGYGPGYGNGYGYAPLASPAGFGQPGGWSGYPAAAQPWQAPAAYQRIAQPAAGWTGGYAPPAWQPWWSHPRG